MRTTNTPIIRITLTAAALLTILLTTSTHAQAQPESNQPSSESPQRLPFVDSAGNILKGQFTATITEKSPWTEDAELTRHMKNRLRMNQPYFIQDELFNIYVPDSYDGSEPYGLLVYVDPGGRGAPAQRWLDTLDKNKLIWIAADNIGNNRDTLHRIAISLDAAWALPRHHYNISPERVYCSGMSGGGRISSWLALTYPEAFNGMIAQGAIDYWNEMLVPSQPGYKWPEKFPRLTPGPNLVKALKQNRHAMIIGTQDPNYEQTIVTADKMRSQRFDYVKVIEMPGVGHAPGGPDELDQAIQFLDSTLEHSN